MTGHIIEIILMLLGAAILGFLIGWLLKKNKITDLQEYITALEIKNNNLQKDLQKNDKLLIDCQTEKRKAEAEKREIEKLLIDCEGKLTLAQIETAKNKQKTSKKNNPDTTKVKKKTASKEKNAKQDNLTKIEGIGPKIASILFDTGIKTFKELAKTKAEKIRNILLEKGGKRYSMHNPETWPEQAQLAADDKWEELKKLQDKLKGGKIV